MTVDDPGSDFMVDVLKKLDFEYIIANPASSFRGLHESFITYGGNTAFEDTLDAALNKVFETEGPPTEPPVDDGDEGTDEPPKTGDPTVQQALEEAQKAFDEGQQALKDGDWEAYGRAQQDLEDALKRAEDAQAKAGGTGGSGNEDSDKSGDGGSGSG